VSVEKFRAPGYFCWNE